MMQSGKWNPAAPKIDRSVGAKVRGYAVVYVVAEEGDDRVKIGCSTGMKARLSQLQADQKRTLHIAFWAKVDAGNAFRLEASVHAVLVEQGFNRISKDWFIAPCEAAAWQVIESAKDAGIQIYEMAGAPGDVERDRTEVEEILSKDAPITRHFQRQPRYIWAPQAGSLPPLTAKKKCAI